MSARLLLHSCCAPCSSSVIERLREHYDICIYYDNSNIHPEDEYLRRMHEMQRYARERLHLALVIPEYRPQEWFASIRGHEDEPERGQRCTLCYGLRMEQSAAYAAAQGYDIFGTVLSISPHKDAERINRIGRELAHKYKLDFLEANFKKQGGFQRSLEISRQEGFYRQSYCGCLFSRLESEARRARRHNQ